MGYDAPPVASITLSAFIMRLSVLTPVTAPFSDKISTARSHTFSTFFEDAYFKSAPRTSLALSLTGKTLPPRSVFVGTPRAFKCSIISVFVKLSKALYKNLPFVGVFSINSPIGAILVTLHLPFPVMLSFLPQTPFFSISTTFFTLSLSLPQAISPAAPPPITATVLSVISYRTPHIRPRFFQAAQSFYVPVPCFSALPAR